MSAQVAKGRMSEVLVKTCQRALDMAWYVTWEGDCTCTDRSIAGTWAPLLIDDVAHVILGAVCSRVFVLEDVETAPKVSGDLRRPVKLGTILLHNESAAVLKLSGAGLEDPKLIFF